MRRLPLLLPALLCASPLFAQTSPPSSRLIPPDRLPPADSVLLAALPVRVTPAREFIVTSPLAGELTLLLPPSTRTLAEGQTWGEIERERIELESLALEKTEALFAKRERPDWFIQQFQDQAKTEDRLNQIAAEKSLLTRIEDDPELTELYFQDRADGSSPLTAADLRARLDAEESLLRQRITYVGSEEQIDIELGLQELKLAQQRHEFQRRVRSARLTAPFAGDFRLLFPTRADQTTYLVESGQEIARFQDNRAIHVQLPITQPSLRTLPVSSLEVRLGSPRQRLTAQFLERDVIIRQNREELVYIFALTGDAVASARPLVGGMVQAELWFRSSEPLRLARKLTLASEAPDLLRTEGWNAVVASLYPGWRVVCVGQHQIGLAPAP